MFKVNTKKNEVAICKNRVYIKRTQKNMAQVLLLQIMRTLHRIYMVQSRELEAENMNVFI